MCLSYHEGSMTHIACSSRAVSRACETPASLLAAASLPMRKAARAAASAVPEPT
jgi:hypothetical protein